MFLQEHFFDFKNLVSHPNPNQMFLQEHSCGLPVARDGASLVAPTIGWLQWRASSQRTCHEYSGPREHSPVSKGKLQRHFEGVSSGLQRPNVPKGTF